MALEGYTATESERWRKLQEIKFALQRPFTWPSSSPAALVLGKKREVKAIEGLPQALGSSTVFLRGFYEGRSVPYLWLKPQKTEKGSEEPQKEQINSKHRALAYIQ